jgi:hypothetical protein
MHRTAGFTRREFLYAGSLTLLLTACRKDKQNSQAASPAQPWDSTPEGAVSLAALQIHAKRGLRFPGSGNAALPQINRLTGFTVDGSDVVLFGRQDNALPTIEFDAFVVALRNAYGAGDAYQGDPGCSVDPIPGEDPFRIQKVSVFGMPDCTMAARDVSLDYELKRAGAGIQGEDGKLLPSAFELANQEGPCANAGVRSVSVAHRYWFFPRTPDAPRFQRDRVTATVLRPIGVQLLTEQEFLNRRGERTGSADADPAARQFADAVTAMLASDKVARYAQMVHDFRAIEFARLMSFCGVSQESLSFLLSGYELQRVEVPALVGGVQRDEEGRTVCNATVTQTAAGIQYRETASHSHYEYRGGVQAKVAIANADAASADLDPLRRRVLAARPGADAVSWSVA